jgi:hypothetical protein
MMVTAVEQTKNSIGTRAGGYGSALPRSKQMTGHGLVRPICADTLALRARNGPMILAQRGTRLRDRIRKSTWANGDEGVLSR